MSKKNPQSTSWMEIIERRRKEALSNPIAQQEQRSRRERGRHKASAERLRIAELSRGENENPLEDVMPQEGSVKYTEHKIRNRLAIEHHGVVEMFTDAGLIDILSLGTNELIEIKEIRQWKSGIGQLFVYGFYYPEYTLRLHLFGEADEEFKARVNQHAARLNIKITYEKESKSP